MIVETGIWEGLELEREERNIAIIIAKRNNKRIKKERKRKTTD